MDMERASGHKPYFFPVGASVPLGCWGNIRCMAELIEQLDRNTPVDLFCATGSVGTQTGLILGKALFQCDRWRVIGVPITDSIEGREKVIGDLVRQTVDEYQLEISDRCDLIKLMGGFIGEGYGVAYPEAVETIKLVARTEGILLDPTYTAKAMTGMLSAILSGKIRQDALPVFLHTGGAFGLMAQRDLFPCDH
ncbi:MAG: pyridoxal-phosphate dependent enzyme [Planctomycetota bacterium]